MKQTPEVGLFVATLALVLMISINSASAQTVRTGIPVLKDSTNQIIGPIVDWEVSSVVTTVIIDDFPYPLRSFGSALEAVNTAKVRFTSNDCSGTPYVGGLDFGFLPPYYATNPPGGTTIWIPDGSTIVNLNFNSSLDLQGDCVTPDPESLVGAIKAIPVATGFTAPHKVSSGPALGMASAFGIPTLSSPGQVLIFICLFLGGLILVRRSESP